MFITGVPVATALGGSDFLPVDVRCPEGTSGQFVVLSRNIFDHSMRSIFTFHAGKIVGVVVQGSETRPPVFEDLFNGKLNSPDAYERQMVGALAIGRMELLGWQSASKSIDAVSEQILSVVCARSESGKKVLSTKLKANESILRKHSNSP